MLIRASEIENDIQKLYDEVESANRNHRNEIRGFWQEEGRVVWAFTIGELEEYLEAEESAPIRQLLQEYVDQFKSMLEDIEVTLSDENNNSREIQTPMANNVYTTNDPSVGGRRRRSRRISKRR